MPQGCEPWWSMWFDMICPCLFSDASRHDKSWPAMERLRYLIHRKLRWATELRSKGHWMAWCMVWWMVWSQKMAQSHFFNASDGQKRPILAACWWLINTYSSFIIQYNKHTRKTILSFPPIYDKQAILPPMNHPLTWRWPVWTIDQPVSSYNYYRT